MPSNITEVDEFTSPIVAVTAGDPVSAAIARPPIQGLTNRTLNHKNRLDVAEPKITALEGGVSDLEDDLEDLEDAVSAVQQSASYVISAGSTVNPVALTQEYEAGGFTIVSNTVEVPSPGIYLVTMFLGAVSDTSSSGVLLSAATQVDGTAVAEVGGHRFSTTDTHRVPLSSSVSVVITNPSSQRIGVAVFAASGSPEVAAGDDAAKLAIVRLSESAP